MYNMIHIDTVYLEKCYICMKQNLIFMNDLQKAQSKAQEYTEESITCGECSHRISDAEWCEYCSLNPVPEAQFRVSSHLGRCKYFKRNVKSK